MVRGIAQNYGIPFQNLTPGASGSF